MSHAPSRVQGPVVNRTQGRADVDGYASAAGFLSAHEKVAVATVVETWGSAPVPVGGGLVVAPDGHFVGSVSGGCVEADVIAAALDILDGAPPLLMEFGVTDETAWRAGLPCGGRLRIYVDRLTREADLGWSSGILEARRTRRPVVLAIGLGSGERRLLDARSAQDAAARCLADGVSRLADENGQGHFYLVLLPPIEVVIVGATEIARHLTGLLATTGLDAVIVDPRTAFASPERFPGLRCLAEWPSAALDRLGLDQRKAVVALTHRDDLDDEALNAALSSDCLYIGALGSRRNHERRKQRLIAAGWNDRAIARINAPIGLDIGAQTPQEIALSIAAEIVCVMRRQDR